METKNFPTNHLAGTIHPDRKRIRPIFQFPRSTAKSQHCHSHNLGLLTYSSKQSALTANVLQCILHASDNQQQCMSDGVDTQFYCSW